MASNLVREVKLPLPRDDKEEQIAKNSFYIVENYRTKLSFYDDTQGMTVSDFEILMPYRTDNMSAVLLKQDGEIYSYLSKGLLENNKDAKTLLYVSNHIVFGNYGKKYSETQLIDNFDKRLSTVVSFESAIEFDISKATWQPPKLYYLNKTKFKFY